MHQIIHLSPVGCFTPARGKTVQNNREVGWFNTAVRPANHLAIAAATIYTIYKRYIQYILTLYIYYIYKLLHMLMYTTVYFKTFFIFFSRESASKSLIYYYFCTEL